MKKKRLNLENLNVKSFVTSLNAEKDIDTIKGGLEAFPRTFGTDCGYATGAGCTNDVGCNPRYTFMDADTGGCQHTDLGIGCKTYTLPGL
jgi:hypothetical protein